MPNKLRFSARFSLTLGLSLLLLVACGGGKEAAIDSVQAKRSGAASLAETLGEEGARINAKSLEAADAAAAQDSVWSAQRTSGALAKSLAGVPVYRFHNQITGGPFYTIDEAERALVVATLPRFKFEGIAFYVSKAAGVGLSPVHRFYNPLTGVHFYTISAEEKASVEANKVFNRFEYEGVAYYASQVSGAGLAPLFRFYRWDLGFHFYSGNYLERDAIVDALYNYHYEGVGYYVLQDASTAIEPNGKLNDTGITAAQCFGSGRHTSELLVSCDSQYAYFLNNKQDGMIGRDRNAPEASDGKLGFSFTKLSNSGQDLPASAALGSGPGDWACTRDNVTGLVWEVGSWNGSQRVPEFKQTTHLDDVNAAQFGSIEMLGGIATSVARNPTQAEVDATTNSQGYRRSINNLGLCGFSDWRLPTVTELHGLIDYSKAKGESPIDEAWLTQGWFNPWASEGVVYLHPDLAYFYTGVASQYAWKVESNGSVWPASRSNAAGQLRLVRSAATSASPRFSYTNNGSEVVDSLTGLTWRRCLEGMSWSGSACTGTATVMSHEDALQAGNDQPNWRVPNIKELGSIMDRTQVRGYDPVAFPNTPDYGKSWSSTPVINNQLTGQAAGYTVWLAKFKWGVIDYDSDGRTSSMLRLVRTTR